jgi:hypothetical protein
MSRIWEPGKATTPIRRVSVFRELLFDCDGFIALMLGNRLDWRNDIHRRISATESLRHPHERWDHIVGILPGQGRRPAFFASSVFSGV